MMQDEDEGCWWSFDFIFMSLFFSDSLVDEDVEVFDELNLLLLLSLWTGLYYYLTKFK